MMAVLTRRVTAYRCERCAHEWLPRVQGADLPTVCVRCKSPYWNKPRRKVSGSQGIAALSNNIERLERDASRLRTRRADLKRKVNEDQVVQMRLERSRGDTIGELARRYRLGERMVTSIVTGRYWKHAGGPVSAPGRPRRRSD